MPWLFKLGLDYPTDTSLSFELCDRNCNFEEQRPEKGKAIQIIYLSTQTGFESSNSFVVRSKVNDDPFLASVSWIVNPLSPNSVQDQFSPYNYPYTVKR